MHSAIAGAGTELTEDAGRTGRDKTVAIGRCVGRKRMPKDTTRLATEIAVIPARINGMLMTYSSVHSIQMSAVGVVPTAVNITPR